MALFRAQAHVVAADLRLLNNDGMPLPLLTLLRGSNMRLPSGEEFARRFGYESLKKDAIPASSQIAELFDDPEFRNRTPLWYYLLREAAVDAVYEPGPNSNHPMQKLGPMGSQIVAEVFYQVLRSDPGSIFNAGRHWQPPVFAFGVSKTPRALDSLPMVKELIQRR